MNGAGTLDEGPSPGRCPVDEQHMPSHHKRLVQQDDLKRRVQLPWNVIS